VKTIRSRENVLLKHLIRLSGSSRERRQSGTTILDGEHLIEAYCAAAIGPLEIIAASESGMQRTSIAGLMESAPADSRVVIDDKLLSQISQVVTTSGILAVIKTPRAPDLPLRMEEGLFLEGIQDPGNLGSIFRTALGAGVRNLYLSGGSVFAWSPKVIRSGMGAHFHLAIHENVDLQTLAQRAACRLIATQSSSGTAIYDTALQEAAIWMFGNEGAGLSQAAQDLASARVTIPMAGCTESLNVAAAVAICLFEQVRQRNTGR
jgi:TrmH family RNA methyltransferase